MKKIRKIKFINHPILQNLEIDFCDKSGNAVDTVIIAGENGTGKSTLLNCLYKISSKEVDFEANIEVETNNKINTIYYRKKNSSYNVTDNEGLNTYQTFNQFKEKYNFNGIFSDVAINFNSVNINSVTGLAIDSNNQSTRSNDDLPKSINQLIVDTQAADDADISFEYRKAKNSGCNTDDLKIEERMNRFTFAFNQIFQGLTYSRVTNCDGHKEILFNKKGIDIPINKLSSGEKQIVYRGAFLLKDINALKEVFVFIDEPEISLHPNWQKKIMDYYKNIFTDINGKQTSQIFAVTHSPFIIHNENRKNDKVIVMSRDDQNNIFINDKPEYYNCNSTEIIKDAFNINDFEKNINKQLSTIYLEGRTDEKYFTKAVEVFEYKNLPFRFKWVGYMDENNNECNTGKGGLDKAAQFLISENLSIINVCLYDCDIKRSETTTNNVICKSIPFYENNKNMKIGIENALVLDNIDLSPFYSNRESISDYGEIKSNQEFKKMKCCDSICNMDKETLKTIFLNLKKEIDKLIDLFNN